MTDKLHKKLRTGLKLTRGERLFLHRRANDYTQTEMARALGVGVDKLREWERDDPPCPEKVPAVKLTGLPLAELIGVRRRRLGLRIAYIARIMDKSVGWVHRAQTGEHEESAERLVEFILKQEAREA